MYQRFLFLIPLIFLMNACGADCFKSTGEVITQSREVSSFESIEVFNNVNVQIKQGNDFSLSVRAGKNLQADINTEVVNNQLQIKNDATCNWVRNQKIELWVEITCPDLKLIEHRGFGNIISAEAESLNFTSLDILIEGQGDVILTIESTSLICRLRKLGNINLSGKAENLEVFTFDHGFFYGKNLITQNTQANNQGEGNFEITAENSLNATVGSNGNIIYYGNPQTLETNILENSKGQILKGD